MKAPLLPFVCLLALLFNPVYAAQDSYQSLNLAITQQSQTFSYESVDKTLNLQGYRVLYQYGINDWRFSVDYNNASDEEESRRVAGSPQYGLLYETSGINVFAEYNWPTSWLALGISKSRDETQYYFNKQLQHIGSQTQVDYDNLTLDTGFIYATQQGQWIISSSLVKQFINETSHYRKRIDDNEPDNIDEVTLVNENGLLASMGLSYGHYFNFSEYWELYISGGLRRQITLTGEGRTTTHYRTPLQSNLASNQTSSSELQSISQSASTSQQLHVSFLHNKGSISIDVDKLSSQSMSEAYFSAGFGVNF